MALLPAIVAWARERPLWQQDALRRLVGQPQLSATDYAELVSMCKVEGGIPVEGSVTPRPLHEEHAAIPAAAAPPAVRLTRVHGVRNVNALRADQALEIAPTGMTVVYGENGAGKSGYVRVLKQVCRARGGRDAVYPNVYLDEAEPASAVVSFEVVGAIPGEPPPGGEATAVAAAIEGDTPATREVVWEAGVTGPAELAQVSVFDSRSAAVYVTKEDEVAYLPYGTDLIPKLVGVVDAVRGALESEQGLLERSRDRFDGIPPGTKAHELLQSLHVSKARERFEALAALSEAERAHLEALREEDRRYKAENPLGQAQERRRCARRVAAARERLDKVEAALDLSAIGGLREAREALSTARAAAELASGGAFADVPIRGVGSDTWRQLWQTARRFAEAGAQPPQPFPPGMGDDARCVLCQQELSVSARERMRHFEEFVQGETRAELERATRELEARIAALDGLVPHSVADETLLEEIKALDAELASILTECAAELERRRQEALAAARAAEGAVDWEALAYERRGGTERLALLERRLEIEATQYEAAVDPATRKNAELALQELEARQALEPLRDRVYAEIDRLALLAKLRECVRAANTTAITRRNTELLREAVSQPLADEFARQLTALDLAHLPIRVGQSTGQKGRALHGLALSKKTKARVPTEEVLSEGEHRCTALAAFFAEISLQESASTVVFDDPVSSLDHSRRRYVAQRLAEIARTRPVLVFTHDLVFLWMLQGASDKEAVPLAPRYVRRDAAGAGLITADWPWDGKDVRARIGHLRNTVATFPKMAANERERYESEVRLFYGRLRETWERSVEEILFNGALRRFSPEVGTLRLKNLHRITEQHMEDFKAGMTKSSAWIQGHDHAAALALPIPEPPEVEADLKALESWVTDVKKKHDGK